MKVGIDKLGFFVPNTFVDMRDLANARNVDLGVKPPDAGAAQLV